ncbi:MAG: hypothetical protein KVP17_003222 [Porospora cf. gigantea B]|uniref:uncharacterized protein n=1 Tax=Porospora cf. gigantea B TaxID=2853592 RepID=UPI003571BE3D|nr:MAG: hypothetical protein KVP17_003222 [Porospora cf. gigantea B]
MLVRIARSASPLPRSLAASLLNTLRAENVTSLQDAPVGKEKRNTYPLGLNENRKVQVQAMSSMLPAPTTSTAEPTAARSAPRALRPRAPERPERPGVRGHCGRQAVWYFVGGVLALIFTLVFVEMYGFPKKEAVENVTRWLSETSETTTPELTTLADTITTAVADTIATTEEDGDRGSLNWMCRLMTNANCTAVGQDKQ